MATEAAARDGAGPFPPATAPPLLPLRVRGLTLSPPGAGRPALDAVSFDIEHHGLVAVLGPSGSGKTTLLRLLAGFEPPDAGEATFGGLSLAALPESSRQAFRRERAGFLFQDAALMGELSVVDNVALRGALRNEPASERRARARALLDSFGLAPLGGRRVGDLSGGEAARVALLRALYGEPDLLLADEPTAALDIDQGREIVRSLCDYVRRRRALAIVATHDERLLPAFDRTLRLRDGRLDEKNS